MHPGKPPGQPGGGRRRERWRQWLETPVKVLIIDDDVTIRHLLRVVLTPCGYDLRLAGTAEDGLRVISTERPDIVITDLRLPGMSGRELCERTDPLKQESPFLTILLSANPLADQSGWISELRDTVFIVKPFNQDALHKHIRHFLDKQTGSALRCG